MSRLANKVALVTGGSRGIGAAIAKRLAEDGASVAITYAKDASAASAVVKADRRRRRESYCHPGECFTDTQAVSDAVEKTVAALGGLDVLVNNAGTAIPKPFEETTLDEMKLMFDINVHGTIAATTQAALKLTHGQPGGADHHDRLVRGGADADTRAGGLLGDEGRGEDVYAGTVRARLAGGASPSTTSSRDRSIPTSIPRRAIGLLRREGRHGAWTLRHGR